MSARGRSLFVVALVGCLVLAPAIVGVADARPPPQPICGACGTTVVDSASTDGTTPEVVGTAVTIRIDENGTGHWTARTVVRDGETIDWNRTRLRENADGAIADASTALGNARNVQVEVDGDAVVVRFAVPDVARRSTGGVLLVEYFYWDGDSSHWFALDADRVRIEGPPGTTVTHAPARAVREDSSVVWTREGDESYTSYPISRETFVAFADDPGVTAQVATHLAVGSTIADAKVRDLPGTAFLPMLLLAAYAGLLVRRSDAFLRRTRLQRAAVVGGLLAGFALASILVTVLVSDPSRYGGLGEQFRSAVYSLFFTALGVGPAFVPMIGFVGIQYLFGHFVAPSLGEAWYDRSFVLPALAIAALEGLSLPLVLGSSGPLATVAGGLAAVLAPTLFTALGVTHRRSSPSRYALVLGIVAAPLVLALSFGPYGGFDRLYFPIYFVPWALVVGTIGIPAFVAGARFAEAGPGEPSESEPEPDETRETTG